MAFAQGAVRQTEARNHGLAYWVFEQILVYSIFKAWLPMTETYWEYPYPGSGQHADLVLLRNGSVDVVVEAKWWGSNNAKMLSALDRDIEKLRSWPPGPSHRLLLAFWFSGDTDEQWGKDLADVDAYCQRFAEGAMVPVFAHRFPTDVAELRGAGGAYFAMAILVVTVLALGDAAVG